MGLPAGFAELPGYIEQRTLSGERVLVVLLDAFGMRFVERHADHPLLRRLDAIHPLEAQFPTTTTAEMTTLHTGLPVGLHGLYEWNVYEPSLQRVIIPLRFSFAGDVEPDTLSALGFEVRAAVPGRADVLRAPRRGRHPVVRVRAVSQPVDVRQPRNARRRGAPVRDARRRGPRGRRRAGLRRPRLCPRVLRSDRRRRSRPRTVVPEFAAAATAALDSVDEALTGDVGAVRAPYRRPRPGRRRPRAHDLARRAAPTARRAAAAPGRLGPGRLPPRARGQIDATMRGARPARRGPSGRGHGRRRQLRDGVGELLRGRLASVCVLPPPGVMAWLRSVPDHALTFRGHHGGRTPDESRTWLGALTAVARATRAVRSRAPRRSRAKSPRSPAWSASISRWILGVITSR